MNRNKSESCFIKTTDNFYGNYKNNTVELSYHINRNKKPSICWVSVWGNDDTGYEKPCNIDEFRDLYRKMKQKGSITVKELLEMGFQSA